jgi:hypothetical protein
MPPTGSLRLGYVQPDIAVFARLERTLDNPTADFSTKPNYRTAGTAPESRLAAIPELRRGCCGAVQPVNADIGYLIRCRLLAGGGSLLWGPN